MDPQISNEMKTIIKHFIIMNNGRNIKLTISIYIYIYITNI